MMNVIQQAVQKENEQLRSQIKEAQPAGMAEEDVLELKEEFTRRLGAAHQTISRLQACFSGAPACTSALHLQEHHFLVL